MIKKSRGSNYDPTPMEKTDQVLISHVTHLSLINPTSTPPFVILILIYRWREESGWDPLDRGFKYEGLKL
jgi:hypothetical protein